MRFFDFGFFDVCFFFLFILTISDIFGVWIVPPLWTNNRLGFSPYLGITVPNDWWPSEVKECFSFFFSTGPLYMANAQDLSADTRNNLDMTLTLILDPSVFDVRTLFA